jgi:(p)ppGpp synthase/HD superfamily hydrolase
MDGALFEDALRLLVARFPHEPQKKPVLFHSIRTASALYSLGYGEPVCIGGLLHDAIEDTDITYALIADRYGEHVAGMVLANSKDRSVPKEDLLEDIVRRCVAHSRDALIVKVVEVHDNWIYYTRRLQAGEPIESEVERCRRIARLVMQHKPNEWDDEIFGLMKEVASDR